MKRVNTNSKSSEVEECSKELFNTNKVGLDGTDLIDDSLTQNEIYEIVMDTSASKCLKSVELQFKVSVATSDKKNDGKTQVDKELEVNDQATENELRNSKVELEHGILPQNSSHCQSLYPLSSSFEPASISCSESKTKINCKKENKSKNMPTISASILSTDLNEISYCNNETSLENNSNKLSDLCDSSDVNSSILPHRFDHANKNMFSLKKIKSENTMKDESILSVSPNSQNVSRVSLPQSEVIASTDSSSDSEDLIEVSEDPNLNANNSNKPNTTDFPGPSIPTQIIIDSIEELKDDMFSEIFTNSNNDELQDSNKVSVKDSTVILDESNTKYLEKDSCEDIKLSVLGDGKLNKNDATVIKTESVHDGISETNFIGPNNKQGVKSVIPQLSVDEIVVMKVSKENIYIFFFVLY